jgi:hypothetical protein
MKVHHFNIFSVHIFFASTPGPTYYHNRFFVGVKLICDFWSGLTGFLGRDQLVSNQTNPKQLK